MKSELDQVAPNTSYIGSSESQPKKHGLFWDLGITRENVDHLLGNIEGGARKAL